MIHEGQTTMYAWHVTIWSDFLACGYDNPPSTIPCLQPKASTYATMQTVHVQESLLLHDMHSNYMPQAAEQNHMYALPSV